jgi:hypothetical protein
LNSNLFVDDSRRTMVDADHAAASLCSYVGKRKKKLGDYNHVTADLRQKLEAEDAGLTHEFICGVPLSWVPEHDEYSPQTGKLLARGWRSILLLLVKKGFASLDKARRVFATPGLGSDEYDVIDPSQRKHFRQPQPVTNRFKL